MAMKIVQLEGKELSDLIERSVRKVLKEEGEGKSTNEDNSSELLTVDQAAEFLHLKKATIYGKVSKGELPVMKRSKRLYFLKDDLIKYLKDGRVGSIKDAEGDVMDYILKKK